MSTAFGFSFWLMQYSANNTATISTRRIFEQDRSRNAGDTKNRELYIPFRNIGRHFRENQTFRREKPLLYTCRAGEVKKITPALYGRAKKILSASINHAMSGGFFSMLFFAVFKDTPFNEAADHSPGGIVEGTPFPIPLFNPADDLP